MVRTPEDVKKGLQHCKGANPCAGCTYDRRDFPQCIIRLQSDALSLIQQLEANHSKVKAELKRLTQNHIEDMKIICNLERERDAAVADLDINHKCDICAHVDCQWDEYPCSSCLHSDPVDNVSSNFEWRGICPENTEVPPDA